MIRGRYRYSNVFLLLIYLPYSILLVGMGLLARSWLFGIALFVVFGIIELYTRLFFKGEQREIVQYVKRLLQCEEKKEK